jgi:type VI secretion system protein ImpA
MTSPDMLDFAPLLQPISDAEPTGTELKDDPGQSAIYYRIKDARDAARAAERQLAQAALYGDDADPGSLAPPNWKQVRELATEAIAHSSKDLWIAAWLIEALTRAHGFAGLRDGLRLTRELSERFWDGIHPRPDDEGYAHTVAQLTGLCGDESEGALVAPILAIPITNGTSTRPLSSTDYQQATQIEQIADPERRAQRIDKGAVTLQIFERAAQETPDEWYRTLLKDVDGCLDEFALLNQVLDAKCGQNADGYSAAPPASQIRRTLEECRDRVRSLARRLSGADAAESEQPLSATGSLTTVPGNPQMALATGKVVTREDAFRALLQVADFFRRTEPHSPVSYALEQAVRWGRMSLPQLMSELISDEAARQEIFRRVGIPKPESTEHGES